MPANSLKSIQIKNLGVIESANIEFNKGFTVLTGETGAGKTMVLTALNLILGGKAEARLIRSGSDRLLVSAEFEVNADIQLVIEELGGVVEEGSVLITRTVSSDGKSKATIGGVPTTATNLAEIGEKLVEVHAQNTSIRLGKESTQRELLDRFAGIEKDLRNYQEYFDKYKSIKSRLIELEESLKNREAEIERLNEISSLAKKFELEIDVYENVSNEISRLEAVEDLNRAITIALSILNGEEDSPLTGLSAAGKAISDVSKLDKELGLLREEFISGLSSINSVTSELVKYHSNLNADPQRFDFLQSRKAELSGLVKRYGKGDDKNSSLNEIFIESKSAAERISDLSGGDGRLEEIRNELEECFQKLQKAALALSKKRSEAAMELSSELSTQLTDLSLPNAIFEISVIGAPVDTFKNFTGFGVDSVSFNFSSHKSAKVAPLNKSASGGELSRVMLALEVILAKDSKIGTFIFDEVDAGIGGKTAIEVGKKLSSVAKSSQVIVVSHLAQVAAWADQHLVVEKTDAGDFKESSVTSVSGEERIKEIARLLSGQDESASAREHAGELLELAKAK